MEQGMLKDTVELSGVLQADEGTFLLSQSKQRRYSGTLRSMCTIHGLVSNAIRSINWLIGSRSSDAVRLFNLQISKDGSSTLGLPVSKAESDKILPGVFSADSIKDLIIQGKIIKFMPLYKPSLTAVYSSNTYEINEGLAKDFSTAARKYVNYPVDYSYGDMAALIEQLARGLAYYSKYGYIDGNILSGGVNPTVLAIGSSINEVHASAKTIFISTGIDYIDTKNTFAAICWAAAAVRSIVVTDFVNVNMQTDRVMIPDAKGENMAEGIYSALRILGGNMRDFGQGPTYAMAVTTGIHKEITVFSHTDEGSYFRKVLREGNYAPSFGGLTLNHRDYIGLPKPYDYSQRAVQILVDTIALTTAAMVAVSDPLIERDGKLYPTVSSLRDCDTDAINDGLLGIPMQEHDRKKCANIHAKNISMICSPFCEAYVKNISQLFGLKSTENRSITNTLRDKFKLFCNKSDKKMLEYASILPFFWIEPTGLITQRYNDNKAVIEGYGPLAYMGRETTMPGFRDARIVRNNMNITVMDVPWTSARHHGLLHHLTAHEADGVANIKFRSYDYEQLYFYKGDMSAKEKLYSNNHIGTYLWRRAHSDIIAPGEMLYTGKGVQLQLYHTVRDNEDGMTFTNIPMDDEIENTIVTLRMGIVMASGVVEPRDVDVKVARRRGKTLRALAKAVSYVNKMDAYIDEVVSGNDIDIHIDPSKRKDLISCVIKANDIVEYDNNIGEEAFEVIRETTNRMPNTDINKDTYASNLISNTERVETQKAHAKGLQEPLRAPQVKNQSQGTGAPGATKPYKPDDKPTDSIEGGPSDSPPNP